MFSAIDDNNLCATSLALRRQLAHKGLTGWVLNQASMPAESAKPDDSTHRAKTWTTGDSVRHGNQITASGLASQGLILI